MSKHFKEKALLATQYKIDRLKDDSGFFTRNKWKTIGFGTLITILGPSYNSEPDHLGRSKNALDTSKMTYLEFSLTIAVFYSIAVIIAHFIWKYQEKRKLKFLEKRKKQIQVELKSI